MPPHEVHTPRSPGAEGRPGWGPWSTARMLCLKGGQPFGSSEACARQEADAASARSSDFAREARNQIFM